MDILLKKTVGLLNLPLFTTKNSYGEFFPFSSTPQWRAGVRLAVAGHSWYLWKAFPEPNT